MSFSDKIRAARALTAQSAALWARRVIRELPPDRSLALVHELERQGMSIELDLEIPSWRTERLVSRVHTIEDVATITIPAHSPLPEDAHSWRPLRARELQGAALDVDSGLAFSEGRVITQSGSGTRPARDASFVSGATVRIIKTQPTVVDMPIAPMGDLWHHYHFLIDTLPRMLHTRAFNPNVTFVTSVEIPERYVNVFDELDLRVSNKPSGSILIGNPLVLVDLPDYFWPRRADVEILRKNLGTPSPNGSKLYFARTSLARQPEDEPEFTRALETSGFQPIDLSAMPVIDQWRTVGRAAVVAGAHGAALSSIAAMRSGSAVVELTSGDLFESCYRRLAIQTGLQYRLAFLPSSPSRPFGSALDALNAVVERA